MKPKKILPQDGVIEFTPKPRRRYRYCVPCQKIWLGKDAHCPTCGTPHDPR